MMIIIYIILMLLVFVAMVSGALVDKGGVMDGPLTPRPSDPPKGVGYPTVKMDFQIKLRE